MRFSAIRVGRRRAVGAAQTGRIVAAGRVRNALRMFLEILRISGERLDAGVTSGAATSSLSDGVAVGCSVFSGIQSSPRSEVLF